METQTKTPLGALPPITDSEMHRMNFEEKLKRTDFFVEADDHSTHSIWCKYVHSKPHRQMHDNIDINGIEWIQDKAGFGKVVGHIGGGTKKPVMVKFNWYGINGKYICFYSATSRFVDWTMIEDWIKTNFPVTYDNGTRPAMTDASNFHNCYNFCRE